MIIGHYESKLFLTDSVLGFTKEKMQMLQFPSLAMSYK